MTHPGDLVGLPAAPNDARPDEGASVVPLRPLPEPPQEPRETSGMTTHLLLQYVERQGGVGAVDAVLERAGMAGRAEELRDEDNWFSYDSKIRLFEAASVVLDDPAVTRHMGEAALDLAVADKLKVVLRALGSPRLVYQNVVRANAKFNAMHRMDLLDLGRERARVRFVDITGVGVHPLDCLYNQGLLSCVPALFGHPPARIAHPICACHGADDCVYDLSWSGGGSPLRFATAALGLGLLALVPPLVVDPALLPFSSGASVTAAGAGLIRAAGRARLRWKRMSEELAGRAQTEKQLSASLQDLVSDLRHDEVLSKITRNAQSAVGGSEFALLISDDDGGYECRGSWRLPPMAATALERWAARNGTGLREPFLIDDVRRVPELQPVAGDGAVPLRSLCAAPLLFRGEAFGTLIALAGSARTFMPGDLERLQAYADQAAVALANARLFEAESRMATRDALTDLLNHREFHEAVGHEIERCRRHGGSFSVVLFDLDGFKRINDSYGHAEGDRVLQEIAQVIEWTCRSSDRAFRIGGDEFALVLPETPPEKATLAATRALGAVGSVDRRVGASYGIAAWPADGQTKDELLAAGDRKLYAMKGVGAARRADGSVPPVAGPSGRDDAVDRAAGEQRRRLAVAHRLSTRLAPLRDPVEIARRTVAELHDEFRFLAAIHRLDGDGVLRMVAGAGELLASLDDPGAWEHGVDEGVSGRVARTGDAALVPDTSLDPDFIGPDISRSELALPIRTSRRVWGVLNLESEVANAFDSDDLLLADTIAWQVGAALDRVELVADVERRLADGLRQRAGTRLDPHGIEAILAELTDEPNADLVQ